MTENVMQKHISYEKNQDSDWNSKVITIYKN